MMTRAASLLRFTVTVAFICGSATAHSLGLRCDGYLINPGAIAAQVQNFCGAPFWNEEYTSLEILGEGGPIEEQRVVNWNAWYYNFGSHMFMQRLLFRDGRLRTIERLGYGVDEIGTTCNAGATVRGLTTGELIARCGEPASRSASYGAIVRRLPGVGVSTEDRREEWIYDDGSDFVMRYLITNSQVMDAEKLLR